MRHFLFKHQKNNPYRYENFLESSPSLFPNLKFVLAVVIMTIIAACIYVNVAHAEIDYSNESIADAIYHAEGGAKTNHPYGILAHYKHTTPRQACINTIKHARRDFVGGDFITFLGNRYCPIGASNDPTGLNKNWVKNVKRLLNA